MNIEAFIMQKFREIDAKARNMFPAYAEKPVPNVSFYVKGTTGGLAYRHTWEVRFNTHVAAQAPEAFIDTISHEIAHMVDFAIRGRSGHDSFWKVLHRKLGGSGSRCALYSREVTPMRTRAKNEYLYRNANGGECWVGPRYHSAMQTGKITGVVTKSGGQFFRSDWTGQRRTLR